MAKPSSREVVLPVARGYCVSTVGLDEAVILEYTRTQEEREKKEDQLQLGY